MELGPAGSKAGSTADRIVRVYTVYGKSDSGNCHKVKLARVRSQPRFVPLAA